MTYLGLGHALWVEAAERSWQVQLEHLADKAAVRMQEMEWEEKKQHVRKREEWRWRGVKYQKVIDLNAQVLCHKCQSIVLVY